MNEAMGVGPGTALPQSAALLISWADDRRVVVTWWDLAEVALATAAFGVMCVVILRMASVSPTPMAAAAPSVDSRTCGPDEWYVCVEVRELAVLA